MPPALLTDFLDRHPRLAREALNGADSLWLLSGPDGEIYWVNPAFSEWIGYSVAEFTRKNDPVLWTEITMPGASLEADKDMASAVAAGSMESYRVRKSYIPKGRPPHPVDLFVRGYFDDDNEFKFFICEIFPLKDDHAALVQEYDKFRVEITESLATITSEVSKMTTLENQKQNNTWTRFAENFWKYPPLAWTFLLAVSALLFGSRFIELLGEIKTLFFPE